MVFCSKRFYDLRLWKWVTIKFLNCFDIKLKQTERNPLVSLYFDILMLLSLPTHKHISSFMQLLKNSWNQHSVVYNIKTSHTIFVYLVKSSMSVCLFEDYMIFFFSFSFNSPISNIYRDLPNVPGNTNEKICKYFKHFCNNKNNSNSIFCKLFEIASESWVLCTDLVFWTLLTH